MKKGFTLIELLAVIVILAIIALIATPIVLGIIDDSKKSANLRSAEFYIDALELAIANKSLDADTLGNGEVKDGLYKVMTDGNICLVDVTGKTKEEQDAEISTCTGDILEVEVNGDVPKIGKVYVSNGQVSYVEGLKIGDEYVSTGVGGLTESENRVVCQAVTDKTRLKDKHYAFSHVDESYNTVLETELSYIGNIPEGKYEPGDEYLCEVKPGTTYRFYVLSTNEDDTVNLIMDQNITSNGTPATATNTGTVPWVNESDYKAAGGTNWNWTSSSGDKIGCFDLGPITAMNYLMNATSTWSNISDQNYDFEVKNIAVSGDPQYANKFGEGEWPNTTYNNGSYNFNYTAKARLILVEEAYAVGCKFGTKVDGVTYFGGACPLWLTNNLQYKYGAPEGATVINGIRGHWALNANGNTGDQNVAFEVYDRVQINSELVNEENYNGVRPVITINKNNIQ